jgi:predicted amidohydrolase
MSSQIVKVGLAQYSPVHNDLAGTLNKLESIMQDAAAGKVELLVFGETWLSGYPAWLDHCPNVAIWDDPNVKSAYRKFVENSVELAGPALQKVSSLAARYNQAVVLGINERVIEGPGNGTIYNSVIIFDQEGKIRVHHRKLMPTFTEKMLYGLGDGQGLESAQLGFGSVGALICWEHWMPLTRQAMHDAGEQIHIALWPQVHEMLQLSSRHYAFEGRCYVLAVGQIMTAGQVPRELTLPEHLQDDPQAQLLNGGSCIIGPDGHFIVQPRFGEEELIVAEIDMGKTIEESMTLDTSGHYQRPDIFKFEVNPVLGKSETNNYF